MDKFKKLRVWFLINSNPPNPIEVREWHNVILQYPKLYGQPAENGISRLLFPEEELLINENKRPKRKRSY